MVSFGDIVYYDGSDEYFIKKDIVAKDASMIEFLDLVFSKKTYLGRKVYIVYPW